MNEILFQIILTIVGLIIASLVACALFPSRRKVKFVPQPPPLVTEDDLKYWYEYRPDLLQRYYDSLEPRWIMGVLGENPGDTK